MFALTRGTLTKALPSRASKKRNMSTGNFVDYFGAQVGASRYASFRPVYPESFIASVVAKCARTP